MNEETRVFLRMLLAQADLLLDPLADGVRFPRWCYIWLSAMGWNLEAFMDGAPADLQQALEQVQTYFAEIEKAAEAADPQAISDLAFDALDEALAEMPVVYEALMSTTAPNLDADDAAAFAADVLDLLILTFLARHLPLLMQIGELLGFIRNEKASPIYLISAAQGEMLRLPVLRPTIGVENIARAALDTLGTLLQELLDPPPATFEDFLIRAQEAIGGRLYLLTLVLREQNLQNLAIRLEPAGLVLTADHLPFPENTPGTIDLQLPQEFALVMGPQEWRLSWANVTLDDLGLPLDLFAVDGVAVRLLGEQAGDCASVGQGITVLDEGHGYRLRAGGGVQVRIAALADENGAEVSGIGCAELDVGLDGSASFTVQEFSLAGDFLLGGADGLRIEEATLTLKNLAFSVADGLQPFELAVGGKMRLGENLIGVEAFYDGGKFILTSTADVQLGEGLRLRAPDDRPVLRMVLELASSATHQFDVAGVAEIATGAVGMTGELVVSQSGGRFEVESVDIQGTMDDLHITSEVLIAQARAALNYDAVDGFALLVSANSGMFRRDPATAGDTLDDYILAVERFEARVESDGQRTALAVRGAVSLADTLFSDGTARPTAELDQPLSIVFDPQQSPPLRIAGSVLFQDFSVTLPALNGDAPRASLVSARLVFSDDAWPVLEELSGDLSLPLPGAADPLQIGLSGVCWHMDGLPEGAIALTNDAAISLGGNFTLVLQGSPDSTQERMALTVARAGGETLFTFSGAARVDVPLTMLSRDAEDPTFAIDGAAISLQSAGRLEFSTEPGVLPLLRDLDFAAGGTFRMGSSPDQGLLIEDALIAAQNVQSLFGAAGDAFRLELGGKLAFLDLGASLSLAGAAFTFAEPGQLPSFAFADNGGLGMALDPDKWDALPVKIDEPSFILFKDGDRSLPDLLAPDNMIVTLSPTLNLPMGEAAVMARADNVQAQLQDGLLTLRLDGFGFGIDDLVIPPTLELSGAAYISGIGDVLLRADPAALSNLYLAGKLGGKFNGTGLMALVAFNVFPPEPVGLSLDVSGGPAGIPLGPTGFLLTGVTGGVSLTNEGGDPTDFASFISYKKVATEEVRDAQGRVIEPGTYTPVEPPHPMPDEAEIPEGVMPSVRPDCPGDCPPPSMNILCQPHPDPLQYPGRAILKFTAIDDALLDLLPGPGPDGQTLRGYLQSAAGITPAEVAGNVIAALREWFEEVIGLPITLIDGPLGLLEAALLEAIDGATNGQEIYDAVAAALYAGLDCPDMTLQLTGTFSYAGVSAFLSVTGGVNLSTTGSAGIVGSLNVMGIPLGNLRAFLNFTDTSGKPDLALCGDVTVTFGPLELGMLALSQSCDGCITGQVEVLVNTLQAAISGGAEMVVAGVVDTIDPSLLENGNVSDLVGTLSDEPELAMAILSEILLTRPAALSKDLLHMLIKGSWEAFNPQYVLCGRIAPKLFGLPLGGELVSAQGWINKLDIGAAFAFSPAYLMGRILPLADMLSGMDRAVMGFSLAFPDTVQFLLDGMNGTYRSADELGVYLGQGFDRMLDKTAFTLAYDIAPFGLKLTRTAARIVMPELSENHPVYRDATDPWERPEERGLPSRMAVLQAALLTPSETDPNTALLADIGWPGDLAKLDAQTLHEADKIIDMHLSEDYFPHGGILGAARLEMPRALTDEPPQELLETIFDANTDPMERIMKAGEYIGDYLLTTEEVGTILFYDPAPNPPGDAGANAPRALMEGLVARDYEDQRPPFDDGYSGGEAFLHGYVDGKLLGIPIIPIIEDEMIGTMPEKSGTGEASFEVGARLPRNEWLTDIVGEIEVTFSIRQAPPWPIEAYFTMLGKLFEMVPDSPADLNTADLDEALRELTGDLAANDNRQALLEPFGGDSPATSTVVEELDGRRQQGENALLEAAAAFGEKMVALAGDPQELAATSTAFLVDALASQLPKIALCVDIEDLTLPDILGISAGADARLEAFSLYYAYEAGQDPQTTYDRIRQYGGILLTISDMTFQVGPFNGDVKQVQIAVGAPPPSNLAEPLPPHLLAEVDVGSVSVPGLELEEARLRFSTHPAQARLSGRARLLDWGVLRLEPLSRGGVLRVTADATGSLRVNPARMIVSGLASRTSLHVHGDRPGRPFKLSTSDPWSATVRLRSFCLVDPSGQEWLCLGRPRDGAVLALSAEGDGTTSLEMTGEVPHTVPLLLFPGTPLEQEITSHALAPLQFSLWSDGRFSLAVTLQPLPLGIFQLHGPQGSLAGVPVTVDETGVRVPRGTRMTIAGFGSSLRLDWFTIRNSGDFEARVGSGELNVPGFCRISRGQMMLRRENGTVSLVISSPVLELFPDTEYEQRLTPGELVIDSAGRFSYDSSDQMVTVPGLFSADGRFEVAYDPQRGGSVEIPNAQLEIEPLNWTAQGRLSLSPQGFTATAQAGELGFDNLLTVGAAAWDIDYSANDGLSLEASAGGAAVLGKAIAPPADFHLQIDPDGSFVSSFEVTEPIAYINDLLQIGPGWLQLAGGPGSAPMLRLQGDLRAFNVNGDWLVDTFGQWQTIEPGRLPLPQLRNRTLLDVPDVLTVRTDQNAAITVQRQANGAYIMDVEGFKADLFGNELSLPDTTLDASRVLNLPLSGSSDNALRLGPFTYQSAQDAGLGFNLDSGALALVIPGDGVFSSAKRNNGDDIVPGLTGVKLPELTIDENGYFDIDIDMPFFDGFRLSDQGSENSIRLQGPGGEIEMHVRNQIDFLGSQVKMRLDMDADGVSGSIKGTIFWGTLKFSSASLDWESRGNERFFEAKLSPDGSALSFLLTYRSPAAAAIVPG